MPTRAGGYPPLPPPYPLPKDWRVGTPTRIRPWTVVIYSLVVLGSAAALAFAVLGGNVGAATWWVLVFAGATLGFGVHFERAGGERGMPELLNAVALTRAEKRPPDSWVHFFRERGAGSWVSAWFTVAGVVSTAAFVWAIVRSVTTDAALALIWLIPLLLGALVVLLAGSIAIVSTWRAASFGRLPIGVGIGPSGVTRYYLDDTDDIDWARIARVAPTVSAVDETTGDFTPSVELRAADDEILLDLNISGFRAHAWLIYASIRFWAEHPEMRHELGTTFAQQRMDGWRRGMLGKSVGDRG
ncbi:hypothetical protein [Microbacterium sp. 77mftsu3.1]|uniref:hypothetical protein n=1 Tax=Microbacterium sp. 77mftsu3.1 TaxID=1761802 RepID=UPI00035FFE7C|nr:hypothetical protein [Microbacterium sp. 77mftsu3.1]SDG90423.1 hypothetical protein SAMN04488590_2172 [Microbacterium sp. 77mftsu3.1]